LAAQPMTSRVSSSEALIMRIGVGHFSSASSLRISVRTARRALRSSVMLSKLRFWSSAVACSTESTPVVAKPACAAILQRIDR
jgi:hypothetical protein